MMNKVDENSRKYKFLNYRGAISGVDIYLYFLLLCSESCSFVCRLSGDTSSSFRVYELFQTFLPLPHEVNSGMSYG